MTLANTSAERRAGEHWLERIVSLSRDTERLDVRAHEGRDGAELLASLCREVRDRLERAISLLKDLVDAVATPEAEQRRSTLPPASFGAEGATQRFDRRLDALVKDPRADAADIAFIALGELSHKRARVVGLTAAHDPWQIIAECGSAIRRIRKSLAAIEHALAGPDSILAFSSVVETSLAVRREYVALRRVIQVREPRDEAEARAALRAVGTRMAMLIGRPVYHELRIPDRVQIRLLQERILDWLRRPADLQDGRRILQDLRGFAAMLAQVNRREELVAHDTALLREALAALPPDGAPVPRQLLERLRELDGLDEELDDLLRADAPSRAPLRAVLARLRRGYPSIPDSAELAADRRDREGF